MVGVQYALLVATCNVAPPTCEYDSGLYAKLVVVSTSDRQAVKAQASLNSGFTRPAASFSARSFQKPCRDRTRGQRVARVCW